MGICAVGDDSKSIFSLIGYNVDQLWVFGKDNIQKLIDTLNDLYNALTGEESNEDTNAVWAGVIFGLLAGIGAPVASPVTALGLHIDVHAIFEPLLASVRNDINGLRSALAYINNADQSGDHQYDNLAYGIVTVTGHGPTPFDSMNWGGPVLVSWQPGSDYVNM